MKKRLFSLILLLLAGITYIPAADNIVWNFEKDTEGWHDLGEGRDVTVSWENGKLKYFYEDRSPQSGSDSRLWFPAAEVGQLNFNADDYQYIELYYQCSWPTKVPQHLLVEFLREDGKSIHAFAQIDPIEGFLSINISAAVRTDWGGVEWEGKIVGIRIELPHNSSPQAQNGADWFGKSYTLIDKITLTDIAAPKPEEPEVKHWRFDTDFSSTDKSLTAMATGKPSIDPTAGVMGDGALVLDGESHLTMPIDPFFNTNSFSCLFWMKLNGSGQKNGSNPAQIVSYNPGYFKLGINKGELVFQRVPRLWDNVSPVPSNEWLRVAMVNHRGTLKIFINGKQVTELSNISKENRTGELMIGYNGLMAVIDDMTIMNHSLSDQEVEEDGRKPVYTIQPFDFTKGLQGWHEIEDGSKRDIGVSWDKAMVMTYVDNTHSAAQLWFPQVEVACNFEASYYTHCDIHYETVGWPQQTLSKGLLEMKREDGSIAYAYFDLDPTANHVQVDLQATNPGWGAPYEGRIVSVRLEIPHNGSANPAAPWYGAATKIDQLEFNKPTIALNDRWEKHLESAAFHKTEIISTHQYQPIGLAGTALRIDPWGFSGTPGPGVPLGSGHIHQPYFGYEYWWDKEGHRFNPFTIRGGYGNSLAPGNIKSYEQQLDIRTGELVLTLTLEVAGKEFTSRRTALVTPEGVWVLRVCDEGAPSPIQMNVEVLKNVRIYNNGGIYNKQHEPFAGGFTPRDRNGTLGGVVQATRTGTADSYLAVVLDAASPVVSESDHLFSSSEADGTVTFYIAPASSFNPTTVDVPFDHAWNKAFAAKTKGYDALKRETSLWWSDYLNRSKIALPDDKVGRLYAQSLYYHGVYFGKTAIPPGCNSTDIESFGGAICPEYDLTFSQLALLYTGHLKEAKNIAQWTYDVLPTAKKNATEGIRHHNFYRKYDKGAIYTTLMGYDGALTLQPVDFEGRNLLQNYPGTNAALMALSYIDYANDKAFEPKALDILKSVTTVALEDLILDTKGYRCQFAPNTVQQAGVLMAFEQCKKRNILEPEWNKYDGKIIIPKTVLFGDSLIAGGVGAVAVEGQGDATWLTHIWWNNIYDKRAKEMFPSYLNVSKSATGDYIFNNGTMGVVAAKLYLGNEALKWLRNFERPKVYYDETCFTEAIGNHQYTPEIGAHAAYICNVTQMLIDPDNDRTVDIFPAIPEAWDYEKIGFNDLMSTGGLTYSASRDINRAKVTISNTSPETLQRTIRIRAPRMLQADVPEEEMEDDFAVAQVELLSGESTTLEYTFKPKLTTDIEQIETDGTQHRAFPNPNKTGVMYIKEAISISSVTMFTLAGHQAKHFEGGTGQYDISDLAPGCYLVVIRDSVKGDAKQLLFVE